MKLFRIILLIALLAAAFVGGYGYGRWYGPRPVAARGVNKPAGYHCPMHPHYHSDKPGSCPICGMKLVPDADAQPAAASEGDTSASLGAPAGAIHITPEKQQLIGVKFSEALPGSASHVFRTAGQVTMDETRVTKVQTRVDGWVEQVFVDFTGKFVTQGQPLLTMYSPEMLASQREYLLALRSREILSGSPLSGTGQQSDALVAAARKRLELLSLSAAQIDEIGRTRQPLTNITLYSPVGGYVTMRNAFPKQRVTPETELYTVTDLSQVWITADVFEDEAGLVRNGMPVRVTPSYGSSRPFTARVSYIQPAVDPATRTLRVRLDAANPDMALKPGMFVTAEFSVARAAGVTVPAESVLDSGLKKTVFVDRGNGYLEPREVETGDRVGERLEITKGLAAGERVVTSGNFLIDSESQLKPAPAAGQHSGAHHD